MGKASSHDHVPIIFFHEFCINTLQDMSRLKCVTNQRTSFNNSLTKLLTQTENRRILLHDLEKTMQNSGFKFDLNFKTKIKEAILGSKGYRVIVHE